MRCKNCGHGVIYSDEYEYWMHTNEVVKYEKDESYDFCVDEKYCAVGVLKTKKAISCGCTKPEKVKP